jgi:hypothetical protein
VTIVFGWSLKHRVYWEEEAILIRLASIMSMVSLVACVSPPEQTTQQAAASTAREAWWPIQFADQNKCAIEGFQPGTDAFAQCVSGTIERQREPHRCTYCRSVD